MWKYGCPKRPDWDSESSDDFDYEVEEKTENMYGMWNVRYVLEGPLWVSVRIFLVPDDVLCVRTTAAKWNIAGLYGPFAELYFFLIKKRREEPQPSVLVWEVTRDIYYRQKFGFDLDASCTCFNSDVFVCHI